MHNLDAKNHQDISAFLNYILSYSLQEAQKKNINFYAKNLTSFICAACSEHGILSLQGKSELPNLFVRTLWQCGKESGIINKNVQKVVVKVRTGKTSLLLQL